MQRLSAPSLRLPSLNSVLTLTACAMVACTAALRTTANAQDRVTGPWILDSSRTIEVWHLGQGLNTETNEYAPVLSQDGLTLFFVSNRPGGKGLYDVWFSTKPAERDAVFSAPATMPEPINSAGNEGAMTLAGDATTFYTTACIRPDGSGDCDIYEGVLDGAKVTRFRNLQEVNSPAWDAQPMISSDGNTLLFVSTRRGARGDAESDIFMATKDADGEWSDPQPLPAPINSPNRDDSPCITLGGGALLFSSNRPGGYGGFDIYIARRKADGTWEAPRNLGPTVNTSFDERFVTATQNGDELYFSSKRTDLGAQGEIDLYGARVLRAK